MAETHLKATHKPIKLGKNYIDNYKNISNSSHERWWFEKGEAAVRNEKKKLMYRIQSSSRFYSDDHPNSARSVSKVLMLTSLEKSDKCSTRNKSLQI